MRQSYPTPEQTQEAIDLIEKSVESEAADAMFYEWLIGNIPKNLNPMQQQEMREIIKGIRDDEMAHNKVFKTMYKQLAGREAEPEEEEVMLPGSFLEGISKALKGELNAVKTYRKIMAGLPNNSYRDSVFNILTDELRHGNLYNYIYTVTVSTPMRSK